MLEDLVTVTKNTEATLRETRALTAVIEPHLQRFTSGEAAIGKLDLTQTLGSLNALTDRSLSLVRELRGALPADPARSIAVLEHRLDRVVRRWIIYVLMAALAWTAFFWCAYFLVRRL